MIRDPRAIEALRELGVNVPEDLNNIQRAGSFEKAQQALADLKERVRKNYRRLAFELHPDRTGGDSARTEHFMLLSRIKEEFEALRLRPPIPRPPAVQIMMTWLNTMPVAHPTHTPTGGTGSVYQTHYTTASPMSSTTTMGFNPYHVVIMRPR